MPDDDGAAILGADPFEGQPAPSPEPTAGGEPQAPPDPGTTAGGEPRLYAGRFQSVDELERAYGEANSAIGRKDNELGQTRQEINYWRQQMGYDALGDEGEPAAAAPPPQPQAPWGGQPYGVQPPAPPPPGQGYPQAPPQPQTPFEAMMTAFLGNNPREAQRIFEQQMRGTAEHVTGARSRAVEQLRDGLSSLTQKHDPTFVARNERAIVGYMRKGLSADDAFFLVNRGTEAAQQRTAAEGAQLVAAGRSAASGPAGVPTPAQPPSQDPAAQLKAAILGAGPKATPAYDDL